MLLAGVAVRPSDCPIRYPLYTIAGVTFSRHGSRASAKFPAQDIHAGNLAHRAMRLVSIGPMRQFLTDRGRGFRDDSHLPVLFHALPGG
jgi:hypothetical protein